MDVLFRQKGEGPKNTRTKPSRQKSPDKPPNKIPRVVTQTPSNDMYVAYACNTKNWGIQDVWHNSGGPAMCDKVCQKEGVKIGPKQRNVVYERPLLRDFTVGCITRSSKQLRG